MADIFLSCGLLVRHGGGRGLATINLNLVEESQNGRTGVCVLTTNQMTLNGTIRVKNLTF
jgi:hypothetical protein